MAAQAMYTDKKEQLAKIQSLCIPGETIFGVFDMRGGGTGFLGITSKRIIVYDKQFMRKIKAVVSVPHSRIHAVASEDESGLLTGRGFAASSKLIVKTATENFEFDFRGADKAHMAHNMMLSVLLD